MSPEAKLDAILEQLSGIMGKLLEHDAQLVEIREMLLAEYIDDPDLSVMQPEGSA